MLENCYNLYYPGSGADFEVLNYFIKNSTVKNFFYCDYWFLNNNLSLSDLPDLIESHLNNYHNCLDDASHFKVSFSKELSYTDFNQESWSSFWHKDYSYHSEIEISEGSGIYEFKITKPKSLEPKYNRKTGKTELEYDEWKFIYMNTEGIKTYKVLLDANIYFDIVVTQNHGLGGFWTGFCRGSLLEKYAIEQKKLPKYILLDEHSDGGWDSGPWDNFSLYHDEDDNPIEIESNYKGKRIFYNHTIAYLNDYLHFNEFDLYNVKIRFIREESTTQSISELMKKKFQYPENVQENYTLFENSELRSEIYDDKLKEIMRVGNIIIGLVQLDSSQKYWLMVCLDEVLPYECSPYKKTVPMRKFQKYVRRMVMKLPFKVNNNRIYNAKKILNYMEVVSIQDVYTDFNTLKEYYK